MLRIRIDRRKYSLPAHWDDITLSQCVWLYDKVNGLSDNLKAYYQSFVGGKEPGKLAHNAELLAFSVEVLEHITKIPHTALLRLSPDDMHTISSAIVPRLVCGVLGVVDYAPRNLSAFRCRGRRYRFPETGADVMGAPTPLSRLSALELCQVSDIVLSGNISLAPLALAICCRPRSEKYDEAIALRRAARFARLPASTYWELWHMVSAAHEYLRGNFPECYGKAIGGEKQAGKPLFWSDMLVAMAVGNPGSLSCLQQMNGYDFVHLMNERIKQKTEEWKMNAALSGLRGM